MKRAIALTVAVVAGLGAVGFSISASASTARPKAVVGHIISAWPNDVSMGGTGGYIVWSNGKVVTIDGAPFYGSFNIPTNNVVGFAENGMENGYWVVTSTGAIYGTHGVCSSGETLQGPHVLLRPGERVVGAISSSGSLKDFALVTNVGRTFDYSCNFNF
jgi:hypothetical protein